MNARQALELFRRRAAAKQVMNLRTGRRGAISASVQAAIESSFRAAITHAGCKSDLTQIPYHAFAEHLPEHAVRHALEHGQPDGANRAARCRRFVATIDDRVRNRRRFGKAAIPDGWRELYEILHEHERGAGRRTRKAGFLVGLAQAVAVHGVREPAQLPRRTTLKEWLLDSGSVSRQAFDNMMVAYRAARQLWLIRDPQSALPDIDRCPAPRASGHRRASRGTGVRRPSR